jgi:hypothetical protein
VLSWVKPKKDHEPTVTMLLKFKFDDRSALRLMVGVADNVNTDRPEKTWQPGILNGRYRVGAVPMRGRDIDEPISMGLDLSDLATALKDGKSGKFFLRMERKELSRARGELHQAAILFYEKGKRVRIQEFKITEPKFGEKPLELSVETRAAEK